MIRSKAPKDEELKEENLVGKSIVDPDGHIIAKCVSLFEDEKSKIRMKISILTELNSNFIVEETIPVNLISKIGEVILLKKSFEIKPIDTRDLIQVEIPQILESKAITQATAEEDIEIEINISETISEKSSKTEKSSNIEKEEKRKTTRKKSSSKKPKKRTKSQVNEQLESFFERIFEVTDQEEKKELIDALVVLFKEEKSFQNKILVNLLKSTDTTDQNTRMVVVDILEELTENSSEEVITIFIQSLKATYNEPTKSLEEKFAQVLTKLASKYNSEIVDANFQKFCKDLLVKRKFCKNVSLNRIHNLNLKVFVNNFSAQEAIISTYLSEIIVNGGEAIEYAEFLKDFNAIIIAYSIIQTVEQKDWSKIVKCKCMTDTHSEAFIESINSILSLFQEGNIEKLSEIFDPKLGIKFSNKLLNKMVKSNIDSILTNVTILPLDTLSAIYKDSNNRIVQIIYDLINNREINAQVSFVDDKTFISLPEQNNFVAFNKVQPVKRKEK